MQLCKAFLPLVALCSLASTSFAQILPSVQLPIPLGKETIEGQTPAVPDVFFFAIEQLCEKDKADVFVPQFGWEAREFTPRYPNNSERKIRLALKVNFAFAHKTWIWIQGDEEPKDPKKASDTFLIPNDLPVGQHFICVKVEWIDGKGRRQTLFWNKTWDIKRSGRGGFPIYVEEGMYAPYTNLEWLNYLGGRALASSQGELTLVKKLLNGESFAVGGVMMYSLGKPPKGVFLAESLRPFLWATDRRTVMVRKTLRITYKIGNKKYISDIKPGEGFTFPAQKLEFDLFNEEMVKVCSGTYTPATATTMERLDLLGTQ